MLAKREQWLRHLVTDDRAALRTSLERTLAAEIDAVISARAPENLLTVNKPHLPPWLNTVELRGLHVGSSRISLVFRREGDITGFSLLGRDGDVRVIMEE